VRTFPCPKCGRTLHASGEATIEDEAFPTFSCDECLDHVAFDGEVLELPLTFCVDLRTGRAFDAADPSRVLSPGDSGAVENQ
jgi:hypothetical protein